MTHYSPNVLNDLQDCYRVLELETRATLEEVKRSYRELVKVWHPDRFTSDPKLHLKAQEKLKLINLAYEQICKAEAAESRRRATSTRPSSTGTEQQAGPPGSETESKKQAREQSPPPKAAPSSHETERTETTPQPRKEANWPHAAIGFGVLALSLWIMPSIWDDFSKYEAGEGIRTTRKMFLLYQLFGKQGVVVLFLLIGLLMGYVGLCHARALLAGQQHIRFNLKKGHLIAAGVVLGLFVLIGDRPGRHTAGSPPVYTQQSPNYPAQVFSVAQPQSKVREALTVDQIVELHQEALKRNPNLQMSVQEFSRYAQANQTEYDFTEGIIYSPPGMLPSPTVPKQFVAPSEAVAKEAKSPEAHSPAENARGRDFFTVGSSREEVVSIHGEPSLNSDNRLEYGRSVVYLVEGRVINWSIDDVKLKAKYWTATNSVPKEFFTIGSSRFEVLDIHGSPNHFSKDYVQYGKSMVWFKFGQVTHWTNVDFTLNGRR